MPDSAYWDDLQQHATYIAEDMVSMISLSNGVDAAYLASQTVEITPQSQYDGPDLLTVTYNDPDWVIQTSGLCEQDAEGLFPIVDINFPRGTDVWWRLAEVENEGSDLDTASLQITFYHRMVCYLQEDFGPLKVAPGTKTQAEFFKQLVDRIPTALRGKTSEYGTPVLGPGSERSQQIQFVCPEIKIVQPVEVSSTPSENRNTTAKVLGSGGIAYGNSLKIDGQTLTNAQTDVCNQALDIAAQYNAPQIVAIAMIYGAMGESALGADSSDIWQNSTGDDLKTEATAWLNGGDGFGIGGLAQAKQNPNYAAWQIANATEANAVWDGPPYSNNIPHTVDSYGPHLGGTAQGIADATAIVTAYGGGDSLNTGGSKSSATVSNVGQLTRGTSDNPDEDSWTCMQRLANTVNWELYTTCHAANGNWGNYLYYRTGPNNDKKMPSATIVRSDSNHGTWDLKSAVKSERMVITNALPVQPQYTVDNTAFSYKTTKKRRGKVQQKVRVAKPQTPTQIMVNVTVAYPLTYMAGNVVVFENSGPINGRWILQDNTRNILADDFDQWTLGPPTAPSKQPAAETSSKSSGAITASNGTLAKVAQIAEAAATLEGQRHCYTYTQGPGRTNEGNSPTSAPYTFDCSGFCESCYKAAGLDDPAGNTDYAGNSDEIAASSSVTKISAAQAVPGDLVVFPDHVVIYIGNGNCVSMGDQGEPKIESVATEAAYNNRGIIGYYHLKGA